LERVFTNVEIADVMYVTSSKYYHTAEQLAAEPDAGAMFKVTNVGTKGLSPGIPYAGKP